MTTAIEKASKVRMKTVRKRDREYLYWYCTYRVRGEHRDRYHSLGDARRLSKTKAERARDRWLQESKHVPTEAIRRRGWRLGEWFSYYLATYAVNRAKATQRVYDVAARYACDALGRNLPLAQLKPGDGERLVAHLRRKLDSLWTVDKYLTACKSMLNAAVECDALRRQPWRKVNVRPPDPDEDWHYTSYDDLDRLCDQCRNEGWRTLLCLCRCGGLRVGEALALNWKAVDRVKGEIRFTAGKTGGRRTVPMNGRLRLQIDRAWVARDCDRVVTRKVGQAKPAERLRAIAARAGVELGSHPFHDLRRSRAQDLLESGLNVKAAAAMMGHSVEVMMKFYTKVTPEQVRKAKAV